LIAIHEAMVKLKSSMTRTRKDSEPLIMERL
jgi:hypothetical protein